MQMTLSQHYRTSLPGSDAYGSRCVTSDKAGLIRPFNQLTDVLCSCVPVWQIAAADAAFPCGRNRHTVFLAQLHLLLQHALLHCRQVVPLSDQRTVARSVLKWTCAQQWMLAPTAMPPQQSSPGMRPGRTQHLFRCFLLLLSEAVGVRPA